MTSLRPARGAHSRLSSRPLEGPPGARASQATVTTGPGPPARLPGSTPAASDGAARPRTRRRRASTAWTHRLRPLLRPAGAFLASRIAVLFAAAVVKWLFPKFQIVRSLGTAWDGYWYLDIARHGYPHHLINEHGGSRWAFLPAFPMAVRWTSQVTGLSYVDSGVVLAFVFGMASAVAVWLAVRAHFGTAVADRAVLLYVFFPTAYVLSMTYTEGLFIAVTAGCLWALSRRSWGLASIAAVIGSLTRSSGVVLILAVWASVALSPECRRSKRALAACAVAPLGFAGWMIWSANVVGTPFAFVLAERFWGHSHFVDFRTPFVSIDHLTTGWSAWMVAPDVLASAAVLFLLSGLVFLVWAARSAAQVPWPWWIVALGTTLAAFSPFWPTSVLRYSMAVVPVFAAYGWALKSRWSSILAASFGLAQGALAVLLLSAVVHRQVTLIAP